MIHRVAVATAFIAALFACVHCASSRPARLEVRVIDERCHLAMPGVSITVQREGGVASTRVSDPTGRAAFVIEPGTWTITGALAGTRVETKNISLRSGDDETVDLKVQVFAPGATLVPNKC